MKLRIYAFFVSAIIVITVIFGIFFAYSFQFPPIETLETIGMPITLGVVLTALLLASVFANRETTPRPKLILDRDEKQEVSKTRLEKFFGFFEEIIKTIAEALRGILFLIINTLLTILPSAALTSNRDDSYNKALGKMLEKIVKALEGLDDAQKQVIIENWIDQMKWTNSRATRERNANELLRWWLIVLGVLIPVIASQEHPSFRVTVSILGVFVAILTAIAQFRRPDERWRHYRVITENYLVELWSFIALSGEDYKNLAHEEAFPIFDAKMKRIREDDSKKFFGEVIAGSPENELAKIQEKLKQLEEANKKRSDTNVVERTVEQTNISQTSISETKPTDNESNP